MGYFIKNYNAVRYPITTQKIQGLRRAQIGAIHAIASHFTRHNNPELTDPAIVVMPTGSGKTAVLILAAFVLQANRVLVITPSRLVREQVTQNFKNLELLKNIGALKDSIGEHKVCLIKNKLKSKSEWYNLKEYDAVITTPNCISPIYESVVGPPDKFFDLILIDEGHHLPAKTWKAIIEAIPHARKVIFTATPFRLDKREIPGVIIYEFSLKEAFEDKIFGHIQYVPVITGKRLSDDIAIARETEKVYLDDKNEGLNHRILVRTNTRSHADELLDIYSKHTKLKLRLVCSKHSLKYVNQTLKMLEAIKSTDNKQDYLDGIVCMDMLGEGFDFPRLKIAAIHRPHKSFPVTLQFIGRFARVNAEGIGIAKFLAISQTLRIDTEQLFKGNQEWEEIIPGLYQDYINKDIVLKEAISTFTPTSYHSAYAPALYSMIGDKEKIESIPLLSLTPRKHVKVYEVKGSVNLDLEQIKEQRKEQKKRQEQDQNREDGQKTNSKKNRFEDLKIMKSEKSDQLSALMILTQEVEKPEWTDSPVCDWIRYDLIVIFYDKATKLLFINSSCRDDELYSGIADYFITGEYRPVPPNELDRVLLTLESPRFFNIGMRNNLQTSQTESYRIVAGSYAERSISTNDGRIFHRGHVFGVSQADRTTLGYCGTSKVWSAGSSTIPELIDWCKLLAPNIIKEITVVTGTRLDVLSVGEEISKLSINGKSNSVWSDILNDIWRVDWNQDVYLKPPVVAYPGNDNLPLLDLNLTIDRKATNKTNIHVVIEDGKKTIRWEADYSPFSYPYLKISARTKTPIVVTGRNAINLIDYLNEHPLLFYTIDQSLICEALVYRSKAVFASIDEKMLRKVDWLKTSVDIETEVGTSSIAGKISIQGYVEDELKKSDADIVFYDHGSGEIADFITFKKYKNKAIIVSLYHVKGSGSLTYGARVDDLYEVCGQAVKSLIWLNPPKLLEQIYHRFNTGHLFIKGNFADIEKLVKGMSMFYEIFIVQPGVSAKLLPREPKMVELLGSTNDYITRAGCEGFTAMIGL